MTVIGLTGGIASGKSTLSRFAEERGAHVIDADKLGHVAYEPGTDCFRLIVAEFGEDIVAPDGSIDRKKLGARVFAEGSSLTRLTDIVWPEIKKLAINEIADVQADSPNRLIVLEAAVLIEAGWQDIVEEVWTVVVEESVAIERATQRDGVDEDSVKARIRAQIGNDERRAHSHVVIDNSRELLDLQQQLESEFEALTERRSAA